MRRSVGDRIAPGARVSVVDPSEVIEIEQQAGEGRQYRFARGSTSSERRC